MKRRLSSSELPDAKKQRLDEECTELPVLPRDMLDEIARQDIAAYRALLALPAFARSVSIGGEGARRNKQFRKHFLVTTENPSAGIAKKTTLNGRFHSEDDQPAIVLTGVIQRWYKHGKRHRDRDKPAVVWPDGTQSWYQDDKLHRDGDKPADIDAAGVQHWYRRGKHHRDGDQPAVIWPDGQRQWWHRGKLHRDGDKPAVIKADGSEEYWNNGKRVR